jgi:hypothetical protein
LLLDKSPSFCSRNIYSSFFFFFSFLLFIFYVFCVAVSGRSGPSPTKNKNKNKNKNGWFTNHLARHVADTQVIIILCVTPQPHLISRTRLDLFKMTIVPFMCFFIHHFKLVLAVAFDPLLIEPTL